jgi:hypothetical protein
LKKIIIALFLSLWFEQIHAQILEYAHEEISVLNENSIALSNPFAGGINSGQFSQMDLNNDGVIDLVVFDRTSNKISTYIKQNGKYQYAPQFETTFPENLINWVLLRDYNGDNKPDLFTSSSLGVKVYKNTTINDQLSWEMVADPLLTRGSTVINLFINASDLPAIVDLDEDGDLDILVFNFATGGFVEYHKNVSQDNSNLSGLEFVRETRQWGDFQECLCGVFAYASEPCATNGKLLHVSGKAISLINIDADGQKEFFFGEELCADLFLLRNDATSSNPKYRSTGSAFNGISGNMNFPAVYELNVSGDGVKEIIVSPNDRENLNDFQDFANSVYLFEKVGATYELKSSNFLQSDMIDVGENSAPALGDLDNNGTTDLLIGKSGRLKQGVPASMVHYDNQGDFATPILEWRNDDFGNLSTLGLTSIKPKLVDLNSDAKIDLVFIGSSTTSAQLYVIYGSPKAFNVAEVQTINIRLNIGDNFEFADVNSDDKLDLLIGTASGRLDLYLNQGTTLNPSFQIVTSGFQDIATNPSRTNLSIKELRSGGSGSESLLLYDDSGELRIIKNYKIETSEPQLVTILNTANTINIGKRGVLSGGSLLGPSSQQLIIGTTQGGLFTYSLDLEAQTSNWTTIVYPNPSIDNFSIFSNKLAIIDLIDLSGKLLLSNQTIKANAPTKIASSNYAAGLYILRIVTDDGEYRVIRVLVNK